MASITFSELFLAPQADLSDTTYLSAGLSIQGSKKKLGEFRRYAGGRVRLVTLPGDVDSVSVSTSPITQATKAELEALVGELVLYRDGRGRKMYGALMDLNITELPGGTWEYCSASFTFTEITHSEAV